MDRDEVGWTPSEIYERAFGKAPLSVASAPGRLEVLGNHTDYNEGFALSCAVDRSTCVAVGPATGTRSEAVSTAFGGNVVPIGDHGWPLYLRGVLDAVGARGYEVPPIHAAVSSELPLGAGMASSAALECALVCALDDWLALGLRPEEMARIGQAAEQQAVGAPTGLLDQLTSLLARADHLLLSEYRDLTYGYTKLPGGLSWVVVDSGVSHDLRSEYATRRESCTRATRALQKAHPHIRALRDATFDMLESSATVLSSEDAARAGHIVGECVRVHEAARAMVAGDIRCFGELMLASHESSKTSFENSHPDLDRLVDIGRQDARCFGARLSGGGFGGVTIHLVAKDHAAAYAADASRSFEAATGRKPQAFVCRTASGPRAQERSLANGVRR